MKKNKKINILYAFIYQVIFIPIMAYISYLIYSKMLLLNIMNEVMLLNASLVIVLVLLNLVAIYYIAYALNHIFKFELEYHIVAGMILVFITIWFKLYYNSLEQTRCSLDSYSGCLEAMNMNRVFTTVIAFVVIYNLVYIPLHMITKKKGKKIKLSSIKN